MHYISYSLLLSLLSVIPLASILTSISISLVHPSLSILFNPTLMFHNISINLKLTSILLFIFIIIFKIHRYTLNTKTTIDEDSSIIKTILLSNLNTIIPFLLSYTSAYFFINKKIIAFIISIITTYKYNLEEIYYPDKKGLIPYLRDKNIHRNTIYTLTKLLPIIILNMNVITTIIKTYFYIFIKEIILNVFLFNYFIIVIKNYKDTGREISFEEKRIQFLNSIKYKRSINQEYIINEINNIKSILASIIFVLEEYNNNKYIKIKICDKETKPIIFKDLNGSEKDKRVKKQRVYKINQIFYYFRKEYKIYSLKNRIKKSMYFIRRIENREYLKDIENINERIEEIENKYNIDVI